MKKKSGKHAVITPKASKRSERSGIGSGSSDGAPVELTGKVQDFRTNHHEEVDGFSLVDGTVVRFPAQIASEIDGRISRGDEVRIVGAHHETSRGDIQLRASVIECLKSDFRIEINRADQKKRKGNSVRHEDSTHVSPPYREILAEITAIRALLEDRIVPSKKVLQSQHDCVLKELKEVRDMLQTN